MFCFSFPLHRQRQLGDLQCSWCVLWHCRALPSQQAEQHIYCLASWTRRAMVLVVARDGVEPTITAGAGGKHVPASWVEDTQKMVAHLSRIGF
jgi:hypothetical protein